MYEYKGERSVNGWLDFLNEGYKDVEAEEIPMKPSTLREVTKEVNKVFKQFKHAVTNYPLFVIGVFCFILLMTYISFSCTQWVNEKLGVDKKAEENAQNAQDVKDAQEVIAKGKNAASKKKD